MKTLLTALTLGLLASPCPAFAQNPHSRANNTWISISGTVTSAGPDSFALDYGKGTITVEMDDWDWYAEGYKLLKGDKVRVYGYIDEDTFETTKIEAGSVYVKNLGTHFYASSVDEEDRFLSGNDLFDPAITAITGNVTGVKGREFTVDTGKRQIRVDTAGMSYNPLDEEGYQKVRKGTRVTVVGRMDSNLFSSKELDATSVVTLSQDKGTKKSTPTGR